ncbi:hypothetical protein V7S43_003787 [Phytophthora oleae]|uniref:M96 mating-specific protein family n=1 Tax=Phytophthora oleae TaxID=2107226 RepID=A0ABD3FY46_9STRA
MSLLFDPSASSFYFEPDVNEEQLFVTDMLDLFDDKSWLETELLPVASVVPEQSPRALKRLRPKGSEAVVTPKRARSSTEARPRLRNKGKIEILRCEVKSLEDELESLQRARHDADNPEDHQTEVLWKVIATKQSRERERAEQQNKTLKTLLTAQCTLTASLSGVLNQWRELPVPDGRPKRVRGERQRQQDVKFRQRKKQERQQLLATAQQLETQLAKLRQTDATCTGSPLHKKRKSFSPCAVWQSKAEAMKQQRFEAELLNMTLRRALAKEQQVARSLQTTTNKRSFIPESVMYDMRQENLAQTETQTQTQIHQHSQCCNPITLHINPVAVRCEIEATLQRMLLQADTVLNATAVDNSISFDSRIRLDPILGLTTDVTSTTPMNCSLDRAVKLLGPKFNAQDIDIRCVPRPRHVGGERQFTVELGAPYQTVLLDGFGSTCRSDDDNRRLIVWAAISFDRCGALCFRECTWLTVHRSQENPASASVIRSHYSLTAEKLLAVP